VDLVLRIKMSAKIKWRRNETIPVFNNPPVSV